MPPRLRKTVLALHILVSTGWIGAVLAYLPFDVQTASSEDPNVLKSAYGAMALIARWVLVPLSWATLATGIVVSLGSPWGLFRHYWVLISLVLTVICVAVLVVETRTIDSLAARAADPATSVDDLRSLPSTLPHSVGGLVLLILVLFLNVIKPRGLTPYGWRRIQRSPGPGEEVLEPSPETSSSASIGSLQK